MDDALANLLAIGLLVVLIIGLLTIGSFMSGGIMRKRGSFGSSVVDDKELGRLLDARTEIHETAASPVADPASIPEIATEVVVVRSVLVIRAFVDSPAEREALKFFLRHGLSSGPRWKVTTVIVSNGPFPSNDIQIPAGVRLLERENVGYDFGAWAYALSELKGSWRTDFRYVFFINGTVTGPVYSAPMLVSNRDWITPFVALLRGGDNVGISGLTVDYLYGERPHVQSMFMCLPVEVVARCVDEWNLFVKTDTVVASETQKSKFIFDNEVRLSEVLLENGYNIAAIEPGSHGIDYRKAVKTIKPSVALEAFGAKNHGGDRWYPNVQHPPDHADTIFFKTNRMFPDRLKIAIMHQDLLLCQGVTPAALLSSAGSKQSKNQNQNQNQKQKQKQKHTQKQIQKPKPESESESESA